MTEQALLPAGWKSWDSQRKLVLLNRLTLAKFRLDYRYRWSAFAWECIDWPEGERPASYQIEVLDGIVEHKREAVRGPHGLGKTGIAAIALNAFALTRDGVDDWKAPVTASAWLQLTRYFWPEVHKWASLLKWDKIGRAPYAINDELLSLHLQLSTGAAFSASPSDPALIEGAHADQLFVIYDEAKSCSSDLFDATEGAFAGAGSDTQREAYALAISTPGEPAGRFYDIHSHKPGYEDWHTRHITRQEAVKAKRISKVWVEQRRRQWGPDSAIYQNRVEGEFAATSEQNVIPLGWIEAAQERWRERAVQTTKGTWVIPQEKLDQFTCTGVDVADTGEDQTVLALRFGDVISELRIHALGDTMQTAGRVLGVLSRFGGYAVIDVIGIGAGVVARVKEQGHRVHAFNASHKSERKDTTGELGFLNRRAEVWWAMRDLLDPANNATICLPPSDELIGDLAAPRWFVTSAGKIQIESKDDIRKRLGRSPDTGDAVVMAFAAVNAPMRVSSAVGSRVRVDRARR